MSTCFEISTLHTIRHTRIHTPGMTPLNEWSARHRGRYLRSAKQRQEKENLALSGIRFRDPNNRAVSGLYSLCHTATTIGNAPAHIVIHKDTSSFSVDKKNQLDVTFSILYFSSNSCSTCFGQPCAHHQELTTAWCYRLVLVCAVAAGRLSRPVGR